MAGSFQEKRRKELGLDGGSDFQQQRMMDLGMIPDTRPKPLKPKPIEQFQKMNIPMPHEVLTNPSKSLPGEPAPAQIKPYQPSLTKKLKDTVKSIFSNDGAIRNKIRAGAEALGMGIGAPMIDLAERSFQKSDPTYERGTATEDVKTQQLQHISPTSRKILEGTGEVAGAAAPIMGAYGTGGKLATWGLSKLAPNAPKLIQTLARGAGAGLAYGTGREAFEAATGQEQSIGGRAKDIAVDTALFAGGDAALSAVGTGIGKLVQKATEKRELKRVVDEFVNRVNQGSEPTTERVVQPNIEPTIDVPTIPKRQEITPQTTQTPPPKTPKPEAPVGASKYSPEAQEMEYQRIRDELDNIYSEMDKTNDELDGILFKNSKKGRELQERLNYYESEIDRLQKERSNIFGFSNGEAQAQPPVMEQPKAFGGLDPEPLGISAFAKHTDYGYTNPTDTRSHIVSKTKHEKTGFVERVRRFYEKSNDNLQRINQFDKYVEEATGQKLSPSERSYMLALNQRGADMISNTVLTENLVNAKGNAIGRSLKDITKQIPKRRLVDFEDYLVAKHAETRMARGERVYSEKSGMTSESVAQKIGDYEKRYPEYQKIADELYDFSNKLGEAWLVDTGIISRDTWNVWRTENPFWIPMKRDFKDIELKTLGGAKRGFASQNSPVKAYSETGSERPIISPIESMIEYVDSFVKTAKRNEVMQTVIQSLERDAEAFKDFAEIIPQQSTDDIAKMLSGEDGIEQVLNIVNEGFEKAMKKPDLTKGNVVSALIGGKRQYVKVNDPAFLEALTNLSPQTQSAIINATGKVTNAMKVLTTGINPLFSLTRNIFYDIPQAFAFSKTTNNPIRFSWDLVDGVISTFGNRELYRAYKAMGGGHSSSVAADRNLLAQSKLSIMPQRQKFNILRKAYGGIENLANIIESAPRLGEFKRITKAGGNTYESRVKGLFEAQDVTTNFKRYGTVTKQADAIFPYLNAAIQGNDKIVRAFKDNPVQAGLKAFGAVTVPTVALYAINYDNPKYKKLSNYTKDRFFLIPLESGEFIKIPKPREIGIPFGALVERSLRVMAESDPEAFRGFADQVRIAFAPPGISATIEDLQKGQIPNPFKDTIYGPLAELEANKNFAGAPIVPGYLEGVSPRHQFDANTSELSKKIGNALNVSPKQIDHLIKSYGGVIGQLGIPATTQGASLKDTLKKQVTADPVFSTDASSYFYDLKDKFDTQYNDIKTTDQVPTGYNDGARKYLGKVASTMSDITKEIRSVDASNLPRDEKAKRKRELTELRNELAREAYQRVVGSAQ